MVQMWVYDICGEPYPGKHFWSDLRAMFYFLSTPLSSVYRLIFCSLVAAYYELVLKWAFKKSERLFSVKYRFVYVCKGNLSSSLGPVVFFVCLV